MYITRPIAHKRRQLFTKRLKLKTSYKNWVAEHLVDNLNHCNKHCLWLGFVQGLLNDLSYCSSHSGNADGHEFR